MNTGRRIISADPASSNIGHVHNEGRYGEFHGVMRTSYVTLIVAPEVDVPKIFSRQIDYYDTWDREIIDHSKIKLVNDHITKGENNGL